VVTWSYTPPGFPAGLALSLIAAALVVGFLVLAFLARRPRQPTTHFRASAAGRVNDSYRTGPGAQLRDR
jgi:hypothetical protein